MSLLFMHVDSKDQVWWAAEGPSRVRPWAKSVATMNNLPLIELDTVCYAATHENTALTAWMAHRHPSVPVRTCSPNLLGDVVKLSGEDAVGCTRAQYIARLAGSVGGFRTIGGGDVAAAFLIQHLRSEYASRPLEHSLTQQAAKKAVELFQYHPAWASLTFIDGLDVMSAIDLVTEIMDPRHHVNPESPDDERPLFDFLGIGKKKPDAVAAARAALIRACWYDPDVNMKLPGAFLHQIVKMCRCAQVKEEPALRVADAMFVRYLRDTWLASVVPSQANELYIPQLYLHADGAVRAMADHVAGLAAKSPKID